jgi:hypothetical protein
VPSVSGQTARLGALGACTVLLAGVAAGCSTTQEKAERQQAQSKHILEARAERQKQKKKHGKDQPGKQDEKGN